MDFFETASPEAPPWDVLVQIEEGLIDLLVEARMLREHAHRDPTWCRTKAMRDLCEDRLAYLLGLDVDSDGWAGSAAYQLAYGRLWKELPACASWNCGCRRGGAAEAAD